MARTHELKQRGKKLGRRPSVDVRPAANSAVLKGWAEGDFKRAMQAAAVELMKLGMDRGHAFSLVKRELHAILAEAPSPEEVQRTSNALGLDLPALGRQIKEIARADGIAAGYRAQAATLAFELVVWWLKQHSGHAAAKRGSPAYWALLAWAWNEATAWTKKKFITLPT
jgi:hypothetical protein